MIPLCCILKNCPRRLLLHWKKTPNEFDEVVQTSQTMISKLLFCKKGKTIFRYHDFIFPACCNLKAFCGDCCTKLPNELDEVVQSSQIMFSKQPFCKNRKTLFLISWWHESSMLHSEELLCAPASAQKHQMSSMRWSKVVKSCHQNNHFVKIEKWFFSISW